jgi:hypothetical protein
MVTSRVTTDVPADRRVVLLVPSEVPTGQAELMVAVESPPPDAGRPPTSRADWTEGRVERADTGQPCYPLRGSVVRYERPTEPVAETDWEVLR